MDILNIKIDKDRNLDVKNSPQCRILDLMSLVVVLIAEIAHQSKKPINKIIRDIKRMLKSDAVQKK